MRKILQIAVILWSLPAFAGSGPAAISLSGMLFQPGTEQEPILNSSVNFKLEVWDKDALCILYREEHLGEDLSQTNGGFSIQLGTGTSKQNYIAGSAVLSSKVFENPGTLQSFSGCAAGVTLGDGDSRLVRIYYDLGTGFTPMSPDIPVVSASYAMVAETLQGKRPSDFVQVAGAAPAAGQVLKWNGSQWEPSTDNSGSNPGTVTQISAGTGLLGGNISSSGTLSVDVGTTTGQIVQMAAGNKLPAVDGSDLTSVNAVKIQGRDVASAAPSDGQLLQFNSTTNSWRPATVTASPPTCTRRSNTVSAASVSVSCNGGETMTGGGGQCTGGRRAEASYPSAAATWTITCDGGGSHTAWAVCCAF